MLKGEPPNHARLPDFLVEGANRQSASGAPGDTSLEHLGDAGERPARVVGLPVVSTPTGEAALAGLPVTALTKRRVGWLVAVIMTVWVLALFIRQVSDASAAQSSADLIRRENRGLAAEVEALSAEKDLVAQDAYVAFEARAYGLGDQRERRFVLAPGAPSLAPDAPGSAGQRVGRTEQTGTPLDSWLELLFGPAR
ncbi:MAG: hypothetical protein FJ038_00010 [Chloroflexi bacterium]|nr:hypothetical protein [Chloroflexota bacterium]